MNKSEVAVFLGIMQTAYPQYYKNINESQVREMIGLWSAMLNDVSVQIAETALYTHIATNKFPPTPAEIRDIVFRVSEPQIETGGEAWALVLDTIRKYGRYKALEGINALPALAKKALDSIGGYAYLCSADESQYVSDRARFIENYEVYSKREIADRKLPLGIRQEIERLQIASKAKQIAETSHIEAETQIKPAWNGTPMPENIKVILLQSLGRG